MSLNRVTKCDDNWELPIILSVLSLEFCIFWVALLIVFCFVDIFVFGELVLVFPFSVGFSLDSNEEQQF